MKLSKVLYWYLGSAAALLCLLSCTPPNNELVSLEEGYQYLFDGKTLDGWQKIGGEATFTVDEGEILGIKGPGKNTFLRTKKSFSDFILKLEVRFEEFGNSGILFRSHQYRDGKDKGRAYGLQYELDPSERSWSGGIYDEGRRKWLVPLEGNDTARAALKRDEWNQVVIKAEGGTIHTWLNDIPIANLVDAVDLEGFIALQVHSGDTGRIRWRNIRIKELGQHQWTSDTISDPTSWVSLGFDDSIRENNLLKAAWPVDDTSEAKLRTRLPLGNFAIRFGLNICEQPTVIALREWRNEGAAKGLQLHLTNDKATVQLNDSNATKLNTITFDKPDTKQFVTITAVDDQITLSVNNQHISRVVNQTLPDRGIFSIEPARCGDKVFTIADLAWVDLTTGNEHKSFYQTLDVPAAPVLSVEQALQSFSIAPGFKVELVAAEPLVEDPVAMAWDANGRLYVVEMRGYMPDAFGKGQNEPVGRVVRLEDTNADGFMDKQTIFLDKLIHPRAVAVVNEGVLIGEPPNLWLCPNPATDGVCNNKLRIGEYGVNNGGSVEHRENGLLQGLDNWLYNAKSNRRMRIVNGQLIADPTLFRGQWGITQDTSGRIFYNTNSRFIMADLFPAELVLRAGANSVVPGLSQSLDDDEQVFSVRVNPGINRAYLDGQLREDGRLKKPTAVSGLVAYRGDQFPEEFANDVFIPEPSANAVIQLRLSEQGINLHSNHILYPDKKWGQREFLASTDERFRPVDAKIGPDGALYIIDMYRGILQDIAFLTEELREQIFARGLDKPIGRGRIWRVVKEDNPQRRAPPTLAAASIDQLIKALSHANGWWRDTAQRLLLAKKDNIDVNTIQKLQLMVSGDHTHGAIHALWTLQGLGELDKTTVVNALNSENSSIAVQALRAGDHLLSASDILSATEPHKNDQILTQQLVFSLRHHNSASKVQQHLLSLIENQIDDVYLRVAVVAALRGQEIAFIEKMLTMPFWNTDTSEKRNVISSLASEAYRSARGDVSSEQPATKQLLSLLNLVQSQQGALLWRQIAMLNGLQTSVRDNNFKPARLSEFHDVFALGSLTASDALWEARKKGRMAFTWPGDESADIQPLTSDEWKLRKKGEIFYYQVCVSCHGGEGQGNAGLAPALALSPWVTGSSEWLARIILQGLVGPIVVDGVEWNGVMPGHSSMAGFDDDTAAGLMIFLRRSWGNNHSTVTPEFIRQVKAATKGRNTPWTVAELQELKKSKVDDYN